MPLKILAVVSDDRQQRFEVTIERGVLPLPYDRCDPPPRMEDRVVRVFVDPELGDEGFTYRLASGAEGSVHVDSVLDVNADPAYLADLARYRSTLKRP